jgi:uncharacterized protein YecT (DUF1311 family)
MQKLLSLGALVFLLAPAAAPQGGRHPCEGEGTQFEATQCAGREYKKADAELNRVYQQVLKQEDAGGQARLKAAQLAWLKFRDTECEYEAGDYLGGTMRPMIEAFCLAAVTEARTRQLKEILKEKAER